MNKKRQSNGTFQAIYCVLILLMRYKLRQMYVQLNLVAVIKYKTIFYLNDSLKNLEIQFLSTTMTTGSLTFTTCSH